jgi:excisionase family DNA binding protein
MTSLRDLPATITVTDAADILGISRRSAYRAAAAGQIPVIKIGRRLLVPTARLLTLLGHPSDEPAHTDHSS